MKKVPNWQGKFNFRGEIWEGRTSAMNECQAFRKLIAGMSRHFGTSFRRLYNHFLSEGHYEISRIR